MRDCLRLIYRPLPKPNPKTYELSTHLVSCSPCSVSTAFDIDYQHGRALFGEDPGFRLSMHGSPFASVAIADAGAVPLRAAGRSLN
jgi:hypothetical protein